MSYPYQITQYGAIALRFTPFFPGLAGCSFSRSCSNTKKPYASITKYAW
jgi:hypothetical protein